MGCSDYQSAIIDSRGNITINGQGGAFIDWFGDEGENAQARVWEFRTDSGLVVTPTKIVRPVASGMIPIENFGVRFTFERSDIDALPLVPTRFVVVDVTGAFERASYPPIVRWTGFLTRIGF